MAKQATSLPELEAQILVKAATKFQVISDNWDTEKSNLREALEYNQKLWTIFVANATNPECELPKGLRTNISNLGVFVFKRTREIIIEPAPQKLEILMTINRELAIGLRT